jgi:hypothetical protein
MLTCRIDLNDPRLYDITRLYNIVGKMTLFTTHLRDMQQALDSIFDTHKRTNRSKMRNRAFDNVPKSIAIIHGCPWIDLDSPQPIDQMALDTIHFRNIGEQVRMVCQDCAWR